MNSDRIEGSAQQVKGVVKDFAGKAVGDSKLQAEGTIDKLSGKAQNFVGEIADSVSQAGESASKMATDAVSTISAKGSDLADTATQHAKTFASELERMGRNNPLMAIGAAVMVGVVIGLVGRRS
jgi:uncharacterized protein YjbJ (UPF0337 family)